MLCNQYSIYQIENNFTKIPFFIVFWLNKTFLVSFEEPSSLSLLFYLFHLCRSAQQRFGTLNTLCWKIREQNHVPWRASPQPFLNWQWQFAVPLRNIFEYLLLMGFYLYLNSNYEKNVKYLIKTHITYIVCNQWIKKTPNQGLRAN